VYLTEFIAGAEPDILAFDVPAQFCGQLFRKRVDRVPNYVDEMNKEYLHIRRSRVNRKCGMEITLYL
jgi:hypothetical protein